MTHLISYVRSMNHQYGQISIFGFSIDMPKIRLFYNKKPEYTGLRFVDYVIELILQRFQAYRFYRTKGFNLIYYYLFRFYKPESQDNLYIKFRIGEVRIKITKDIFYGRYSYAGFNLHSHPFRDFHYSRVLVWPNSIHFNLRDYKRAYIPKHQQVIGDLSKDKAEDRINTFIADFLNQIQPDSIAEKIYHRLLKAKFHDIKQP